MTTIRIRNVPASVKRRLRVRAAVEGVSVSAWVRKLIERDLERPGGREVVEALRRLPEVAIVESAAEILREARGERGASWGTLRDGADAPGEAP